MATEQKSPPLSAAEYAGAVGKTRHLLDKQDKVGIFVPQPHGSKPEETKYLSVHINGVFYWLRYGKMLMVPRSIYELLVSSIGSWVGGNPQPFVMPQSEDDVHLMPTNEAKQDLWNVVIDGDNRGFGPQMA